MGLDGRGFIGFGRAKTFKGFSKGERFWVFRGISLFLWVIKRMSYYQSVYISVFYINDRLICLKS